MSRHEALLVTTHLRGNGEVEVTWVVPFDWSPIVRATLECPEEGGAELDGEVYPCEVTYYPQFGDAFTLDRIQEGSIAATLLEGEYGQPEEGELWAAVGAHEA